MNSATVGSDERQVVAAIGTSDRRRGWMLVLLALMNVLTSVVPEVRAQEEKLAGTEQEFAVVDTGLPRFLSPDDRSQTLYVRGSTTYLELMGPSNSFGEPVGKCGIGLTVEQPGSIARVRDALARVFPGEIENSLVDWTKDVDQPVHWYQLVNRSRNPEHPDLFLWVNGYQPEFFHWLDPGLDLKELGISRSRFLKPRYRPERLLENVTRVTIAADEAGRDALAKQFSALGYASSTGPAGQVVVRSKETVFELVEPSDERTGIISIECRLNRRLSAPRVERFGPRSVLRIENDGKATWSF
jgi:hypothetical protein